jgi:hypothetical protein
MAKKISTFKTKSVPPLKKGYNRFTVYLSPSLFKRLKHRAIDDDTDGSAVVREALEKHLGPERVV